jgi:hypothetical protein
MIRLASAWRSVESCNSALHQAVRIFFIQFDLEAN